jgi:hypothetical protein
MFERRPSESAAAQARKRMRRTGVPTRHHQPGADSPAAPGDNSILKTLGLGALVELLWGVGLLVMLALLSVALWAALNTIGRM